MEPFYRPTRVEISLDAIHHNLAAFRKVLPDSIMLLATVKANAYGHGAVAVAREAERFGVDYLGVAFLDEALVLRRAGIRTPILILGYTPPEGMEIAAEQGITVTIYEQSALLAAARAGSRERPLKVHVKLDTGMGRLGLTDEQEALAFIEKAWRTEGLHVEGAYTHYACADESDKGPTLEQHRRFTRLLQACRERGIVFSHPHAGNSAAGIDTPELACGMLRLGISLYGLYPSAEVNRTKVHLQPVMAFKTAVVMVKTLPEGSGVSYGSIYRTRGNERIVTLPVGYADGYTRMLTGKAQVLIHGQRRPVIGRICMDQCMVQADGLGDIRMGDEVVLFGGQGRAFISADELADALGTINYEITCMVSARVPRVYMRGGRIESIVNPLSSVKNYL